MSIEEILKEVPREGVDCKGNEYKEIKLGHAKDIAGERISELIALFRVEIKNKEELSPSAWWLCKCSCGNLVVKSKTTLKKINQHHDCGCRTNAYTPPIKDLTGKKFGRLTVLEIDYDYAKRNNLKNTKIYWKCRCDCKNIVSVLGNSLVKGETTSCGCYQKECTKNIYFRDLSGERFDKLLVLNRNLEFEKIKRAEMSSKDVYYNCICDCGNKCIRTARDLRRPGKHSCGCISKSVGEYSIEQLLKENNISFIYDEAYFKDLKLITGGLGRYDFILLNNNLPYRLIEFDGEQHYFKINFFGNEKEFKNRIINDKIKNKYALEHNLPLVRIPYWRRYNLTIDDILGDKYLIT